MRLSSLRMNDMAKTLSNEVITAAIEGFEAQQQRIADQIRELRSMLNGSHTETIAPSDGAARGKRKFSPDAIRRMREAQQRRWAKVRGEAQTAAATRTAKPTKKRKLSAAGRKAIQEALRKRWAAKRAETQPAASQKAGRKQVAAKASSKGVKRGA